jgi:hypothetical protein
VFLGKEPTLGEIYTIEVNHRVGHQKKIKLGTSRQFFEKAHEQRSVETQTHAKGNAFFVPYALHMNLDERTTNENERAITLRNMFHCELLFQTGQQQISDMVDFHILQMSARVITKKDLSALCNLCNIEPTMISSPIIENLNKEKNNIDNMEIVLTNFKSILKIFDIENLGLEVAPLNKLCDKLNALFRYKPESKPSICNAHFKMWMQMQTNIRFAPLEGAHRSWLYSRIFEGNDCDEPMALVPGTSNKNLKAGSIVLDRVVLTVAQPITTVFSQEMVKKCQAISFKEQKQKTESFDTTLSTAWTTVKSILMSDKQIMSQRMDLPGIFAIQDKDLLNESIPINMTVSKITQGLLDFWY